MSGIKITDTSGNVPVAVVKNVPDMDLDLLRSPSLPRGLILANVKGKPVGRIFVSADGLDKLAERLIELGRLVRQVRAQ